MCWSVCCGMGVVNTTQYDYIYECYLVLFGKPEQTLGISYMHVLMVYMMCGVHPSLVSWVFVEYCSRETPGIQVGAGNISYHSQYQNKQTYMSDSYIIHWQRRVYCICVHRLHVLEARYVRQYIYMLTHMCICYSQQSDSHRYDGGEG